MAEEFINELIHMYPYNSNKKVALDIGGFQGWYTESLLEKFEKVYVFEPFPENIELLRQKFGNTPNVVIVPKAVSHKTGTAKLYLNGTASESSLSSVFAQANVWKYSANDFITVETITLDDFVSQENLNNIGFIKIDAEGAERLIFNGGKETLKNLPGKYSWIVLETHLLVDIEEINDLLHEYGYKFWRTGFQKAEEMGPGDHYLIHKGEVQFKVVLDDECEETINAK